MVMKPLSEEEILIQEKEQLFLVDVEESKARQRAIINQCNNKIDQAQGQIAIQEGRKEAAQKLLEELEARYPIEVIPEV